MKRTSPSGQRAGSKRGAGGARAKTPVDNTSTAKTPDTTSPTRLSSPGARMVTSPGVGSRTSPSSRPSKIPSLVKGKTPTPPTTREDLEPGQVQEETYREEPIRETGKAGIRYITEDLIKKLAKEDQIVNIKKLNVTLAREGAKKIKYIENLEGCRNLEVLSLSCNMIEKMEKLDRLIKLRELNLSFNCISKIEGIENLVSLQVLNLNGNQIAALPVWLGKKLKSLRIFRIAKNRLETLSELTRLRGLNDLVQLSTAENPMSSLPHARLYTIFYIRSVEILDSQHVTAAERDEAEKRFAQDEVVSLEKRLEAKEVKLRSLEHQLGRTESEKLTIEEQEKGVRQRHVAAESEIDKLKRELATKDDLLRKKTAELTKACEKHYQLEQEMAFQKLDDKFDNLGKAPVIPSQSSDADDEGLEESPYIGRARFKPNQFAFESQTAAAAQPIKMYSPQRAQSGSSTPGFGQSRLPVIRGRTGTEHSPSPDIAVISPEEGAALRQSEQELRELHAELDRELELKSKKIKRAEERLVNLEEILKDTEQQVTRTRDELNRLSRDPGDKENISDDDRRHKEEIMAQKLALVKQLQQNTRKLEAEMKKTEEDVFDDQLELDRLRDKLQHTDTTDKLYSKVKAEVADKEAQINYNNDVYEDLHHQLDNMLARITKETDDIRRLEMELREGQANQNEELKNELEEIVSGLQDYLWNVRKQADAQKEDHQNLVREKEALSRRMLEMETEMAGLENEAGDYRQLQKRLAEMEDSLVGQQALNNSLRQQIQQSASPAHETALAQKLDEAEDEIADLQAALLDLRKQAKRDVDEMTEELQKERERRRQDLDQEKSAVEDVARRLNAVKEENQNLLQQLEDRELLLRDVIPSDDLDARIRDMLEAIHEGKSYRSRAGTSDNVGRTLTDLQKYMEEKFNESQAEIDKVASEKQQLEKELNDLKRRLQKKELTISPHAVAQNTMPSDALLRKMQGEIDDLRLLFKEQERKRGSIPHVRITPRSYYSDTGGESETGGGGGVFPRSPGRRSQRSATSGGVFANDRGGGAGGGGDGPQRPGGSQQNYYSQDPDEEERALLAEIAEEIVGLQNRMKDADRLTAQQLGAAYAQMQALEEEIQRKEAEIRNEKLKRKQFEDQHLQQAAEDLSALHDQVEKLQNQLEHKEKQIQDENSKVTSNHQTIAAQGEEIDYLHDVLGAQKAEIKRLHELIEKMTSQQTAPGKEYADEMKKLKKEVSQLKASLSQQDSLIQAVSPSTSFLPMTSQDPITYPIMSIPTAHVPMATKPVAVSLAPQPSMLFVSQQPMTSQSGTPAGSPVRYYSAPYLGHPYSYQQQSPGTEHDTTTTSADLSSPTRHFATPTRTAPPVHYPYSAPQTQGAYNAQQPQGTHPPTYLNVQQGATRNVSTPSGPQKAEAGLSSASKDSPLRRMLCGENGEDLMFCNVPEHHDLEDFVAQMQKKVKEMRKKLQEKDRQILEADVESSRAVDRLTEQLQAKHDEMDNLDLAIERQKSSLQQLKDAERKVEREKDEALKILQELKQENEKITRRRDFLSGRMAVEMEDHDYEYDYDPRSLQSRQNYLREELPCLEETLAKRKAELRESDKLLKECEADLQAAKQEAKETIHRYDEARSHYDQVCHDSEELERRARDSGLQVIRCNDDIKSLRVEIDQLQVIKTDLEQTVRDINQVITVKDGEFNSLDNLYKETAARLQRVQYDYRITEEKEHDKTDSIKRAEQEIAERRAELDRLRMQIESERAEMECVDKEMGRMRTEHQLLRATVEEKQCELRGLERDLEKEVSIKQREIKELRATIDELHTQKQELFASLQTRRDDLQKTQYDIEKEEQSLHQLTSAIGKHKAELKHVLEMLHMEQTELNRMNDQHRQKLIQLEKTQSALQEEKSELSKIQDDRKKHQIEYDLVRETRDSEKLGIERQETERRALEANINVLTKEREILEESCNSLESKIGTQKRTLLQIEDSTHSSKSKLHKVEAELSRTQVEMDEIRLEQSTLSEDVQILSQHVTDGKTELRNLRDNIKVAEEHIHQLEQELKTKAREKETMSGEVHRLEQEIQQRRTMTDEWARQEKQKRDDMDAAQRQLDKVTCECNESRKTFHKISMDLEKEEAKLNRIICASQMELENIKIDLALKQDQIDDSSRKLSLLKKEAEQKQLTNERVQELEKFIKEKEKELDTQMEEKKQVSGALNRAYRELQTLKDDFNQERESRKIQVKHFEDDIDELKQQLMDTVKELKQSKKKSSAEINDLERVAQDHCARANRLADELNGVTQQYLTVKQQLYTQAELLARDRRMEDSIMEMKTDLEDCPASEMNGHPSSAGQDLDDLHSQKRRIQRHLDELKENLATVRQTPTLSGGRDEVSEFPTYNDSWRKEAFRDKFTQEQDYLKQQLRQQMSRHAESLQTERQKSEGTLLNLKRRLNNLEDVLSNSDLTRSRQSLLARSPLAELNSDTQEEPALGSSPLYSPIKHSYSFNRPVRTRSWEKMPERDLPSVNNSFYSTS